MKIPLLILISLNFIFPFGFVDQTNQAGVEQSEFGMEREPLADHPAPIPDTILQTLKQSDVVKSCLQQEDKPTSEVPAAWFVGAVVHLDGQTDNDMIILPKYGCLLGAYIAEFWIFRQKGDKYALVLSVSTANVEFLKSKTRGLRDIRNHVGQHCWDWY